MNTFHDTRPAGTPAYYLGRAAADWQAALGRSHRVTPPSGHPRRHNSGYAPVS